MTAFGFHIRRVRDDRTLVARALPPRPPRAARQRGSGRWVEGSEQPPLKYLLQRHLLCTKKMQALLQEFVDELRGAWRIQQRWDGMKQRIADQHVFLSQLAKDPLENGTVLLALASSFQQEGEDLHCIIVPAMLLHVQEREIDTAALPAQMTFANQTLRLLSSICADSAGPLVRTDVLMQIYHCFKDLASIAHKAVAIHCAMGEPMRCIRPLLNIVQFLAHRQHHPSALTPFHALFLQCCLATSSYTVAAQMLSVTEILEVSPRVPVSSYDFLSYFYFAGMCCLAVKVASSMPTDHAPRPPLPYTHTRLSFVLPFMDFKYPISCLTLAPSRTFPAGLRGFPRRPRHLHHHERRRRLGGGGPGHHQGPPGVAHSPAGAAAPAQVHLCRRAAPQQAAQCGLRQDRGSLSAP